MNLLWRQASAFLYRDFRETASYKMAFLIQFIGMLGHLLVFFFIAKLLGQNASSVLQIYGGGYFPFVLVGIVFANFQATALHSLTGAIAKEQSQGTLEVVAMTPVKLVHLVLVVALLDFGVQTLYSMLLLGISAWIFGVDLSTMNLVSVGLMVVLMMASLIGFGFFSAGFLLVFKRGDPVGLGLNWITKLVAGVYFPATVLPGWLQHFSGWIPLTYALEGLRKALLKGAGPEALTREILFLSLFAAVTIPAGFWFFERMVRRAKKEGTLAFV